MLSQGAIQKIMANDTSISPRLQIIDVRTINNKDGLKKTRVILSDGLNFMYGALAPACNYLFVEGQMTKFCLINLKEFSTANCLINVIKCEVINQMKSKIGDPVMAKKKPQPRPRPPSLSIDQKAFHEQKSGLENDSKQSNHQIRPVSSLNPWQNLWTIKVRCTKKDDMRYYNNKNGNGNFFGVDLLDKDQTEIRAIAFNKDADHFYEIFEKDGVYLISNGQVRLAKKGYSHISNNYAITLNEANDVEIEAQKYNFKNILMIEEMSEKSFVDVIGIVHDVSPLSSIIAKKSQEEMKKIAFKLADQSGQIEVTLWKKIAETFAESMEQQQPFPVVAIKACRISSFGGRSLYGSELIEFNPSRQETEALALWMKNQENGITVKNLSCGIVSQRVNLVELPKLELELDKAYYFDVVGTIVAIPKSTDNEPWYRANPDQNCGAKNAKVVSMGNGKWKCEKNGKEYVSYIAKYILRFKVMDHVGSCWMTAFDTTAEKILGKSAVGAEHLSVHDQEEYERIFKKPLFQEYLFKCKAVKQMWQDSEVIRYDVMDVEGVDTALESKHMVKEIDCLIEKLKLSCQ